MKIEYEDGKFYDDEKFEQACWIVDEILSNELDGRTYKVCDDEYWGKRVNTTKLKNYLARRLSLRGFELDDAPFHYENIGNNCRYEMYYIKYGGEKVVCGYININDLIYGDASVYFEDLELTRRGVVFRINEKWVTRK